MTARLCSQAPGDDASRALPQMQEGKEWEPAENSLSGQGLAKTGAREQQANPNSKCSKGEHLHWLPTLTATRKQAWKEGDSGPRPVFTQLYLHLKPELLP